jgi:hypothetical protein
MAIESVSHGQQIDEALTLEEYELVSRFRSERGRSRDPVVGIQRLDRIDKIHFQVRAIVDLISHSTMSREQVPDDAIPGGCWAIKDLLDELKAVERQGR